MNGTQIDYFHLFLGSFFWPKCQKKNWPLRLKKKSGIFYRNISNTAGGQTMGANKLTFPNRITQETFMIGESQSDINPKTG